MYPIKGENSNNSYYFPDETIIKIFGYLPSEDLKVCRRVNSQFKRVAEDYYLYPKLKYNSLREIFHKFIILDNKTALTQKINEFSVIQRGSNFFVKQLLLKISQFNPPTSGVFVLEDCNTFDYNLCNKIDLISKMVFGILSQHLLQNNHMELYRKYNELFTRRFSNEIAIQYDDWSNRRPVKRQDHYQCLIQNALYPFFDRHAENREFLTTTVDNITQAILEKNFESTTKLTKDLFDSDHQLKMDFLECLKTYIKENNGVLSNFRYDDDIIRLGESLERHHQELLNLHKENERELIENWFDQIDFVGEELLERYSELSAFYSKNELMFSFILKSIYLYDFAENSFKKK